MFNYFKGEQREICPFCFEYFYLRETPFRCTSPMSICTPQIDEVLQQHLNDNRPVGKVLNSPDKFVKYLSCPDCGHQSRKRICPICHAELPRTIGKYKNYIFAVIGAKESGKSHYLAVLINQMKRVIGPKMDLLITPMNDATINRYEQDFYKPVYEEGRVIDATHSALASSDVQKPLVYTLTISGAGWFGKKTIKNAAVLVFFDTAGEDLNAEDTMETVNKYIYRSDGILLLVDPLQLPTVRERLGQEAALPSRNAGTTTIIERTTTLIERGCNIDSTKMIPIPLAVAFSKFDAVKPLIDDQFQLNTEARHEHGFDMRDFDAINSEMEGLLADWGNEDLIHHIKSRYTKHGFFGLSALGCNPHATKSIPRVLPQRAEDPFLWLLAENELIKKVEE